MSRGPRLASLLLAAALASVCGSASAAPLSAVLKGASAEDLRRVFGAALPQVVANSSRGILTAGPSVAALRAAAAREAETLAALLTSR